MSDARPAVKPEDDYSYKSKFSGKALKFEPKPDELMATFAPESTVDTAGAAMRGASLAVSRGINLERGFAAFKVAPEQDLRSAADSLAAQPEIANTLPVMVDGDGLTRYFLPDELTVQFKPEVGEDEAAAIIDGIGSRVVVEQRTPGYYTIAVPEGQGLFETMRELRARAEVAFAEPSEVELRRRAGLPARRPATSPSCGACATSVRRSTA